MPSSTYCDMEGGLGCGRAREKGRVGGGDEAPYALLVVRRSMQGNTWCTVGTSGSIHDLMTGLEKSAVRFRQVMGPQAARNPAPPPVPGMLSYCSGKCVSEASATGLCCCPLIAAFVLTLAHIL